MNVKTLQNGESDLGSDNSDEHRRSAGVLVNSFEWRKWLGWLGITLSVYGAVLLHQSYGHRSALVLAIAVSIGAVSKGILGGIVASVGCMIMLVFAPPAASVAETLLHGLALLCVALIVGFTVSSQRRKARQLERRVDQLSGVYERVQANFEGMKRAERLSALGQLSAGLAHEIRNPLASISGAAGILERSGSFDAKHAKCIEIIVKESKRLNGLLTNFLNFARPRTPNLQTVNLSTVLDNVLALASHGVQGKTVRLVRAADVEMTTVECDPEQLSQVLLNLVLNAIEASPDGETVELSVLSSGHRAVIEVTDHGHGVASTDIDKLFDPFFTTKELGTGLGLPVAHQIMAQMGGSITARRREGGGMIFAVTLLAQQEHE